MVIENDRMACILVLGLSKRSPIFGFGQRIIGILALKDFTKLHMIHYIYSDTTKRSS